MSEGLRTAVSYGVNGICWWGKWATTWNTSDPSALRS